MCAAVAATASPLPPNEQYLPIRPDQALKDGRYMVCRKLGQGVYSSAYLVEDARKEGGTKYLAAKCLTLEGTKLHRDGLMLELEFLKAIAVHEDADCLPILRDDFEEQGPRGSHLCFVMDLLSTDVSSFRRSFPEKRLPFFWVKNIISLVLEGIKCLHDMGIIHTDIKPDNILFGGISDQRVEEIISKENVILEGEFELDGEKWPILKNQPIPHKFTPESTPMDAEIVLITLADLGQGQWAGKQPTMDDFCARSLRPPEIILMSDFAPMMDIWAVGCITFELLTGAWLFRPKEEEGRWTYDDDHLAKMVELTGECFSPRMREYAMRQDEFFDKEGNLLRIKKEHLNPVSIEKALRNYKVVPEEEIELAGKFIRTCLRLDPLDRPSAANLQLDPWLRNAFSCSSGA